MNARDYYVVRYREERVNQKKKQDGENLFFKDSN